MRVPIVLKSEKIPDLFFVIPTIVLDKAGVSIVWLFWAIALLWGKE